MISKNELRSKLAELASRNVYVGTSSWRYPGWLGVLYDEQRYVTRKKFSKKRFDDDCLSEYAEVFKVVNVDATFYQFPNLKLLSKLTDQVPSDFKFSFKVTSEITVKNFPRLPKHGENAGSANPNFLNADLFAKYFLEPCTSFQEKIGLIIFEFSQFKKQEYQRGREFVEELDRFLGKLPNQWNYAVEVRNQNFLHREYFQILSAHQVAHVFNHWTRMPPVGEQMKVPESRTTDFLVGRFLVSPGRTFAEAVEKFSPYSGIKEIDLSARQACQDLIRMALLKSKRSSFIFAGNRLEGNSPSSIQAMINSLS